MKLNAFHSTRIPLGGALCVLLSTACETPIQALEADSMAQSSDGRGGGGGRIGGEGDPPPAVWDGTQEIVYNEALLERLRFTRKCTGGVQAPFNAWLTLHGLRTLPLRIAKQSENAESIANWLREQSQTIVVHHPSTTDSGRAKIVQRQHLGGHRAVVSFELEGGESRARRLLQHLRLCTLVEHVGSVQTLLTHPASMTHAGVAREDRERVGVTGGLLRISVGLEDPRDVIDDLEQAIRASEREVEPCTVTT